MKKDNLVIAKKKFNSRLIVGTGKYNNMKECAKAIKISGAEIVTVAVRRVNISDKNKPLLMDYIDPKKITYLPNTAGCFNSEEALRTLRLAREIDGIKITSPIIGTAYLSPEPGAKKFIEIGQKIKKDDTVMIVEAMKTMNHVPSTNDGEVKKILVNDGQPVEFGQTLVILK